MSQALIRYTCCCASASPCLWHVVAWGLSATDYGVALIIQGKYHEECHRFGAATYAYVTNLQPSLILRCSRQAEQVQKAVQQQQMCTWSLLVVLYAAIEDTSAVHLPDQPTLVDMKRRANLSRWLQVEMGCKLDCLLHRSTNLRSSLLLEQEHAMPLQHTLYITPGARA